MNKFVEYQIFRFAITRKNFEITKSAKFKGEIVFACNDFGIIHHWIIKFQEIFIDLCTTKKWFESETTIFKIRKKLFQKLNLVQEKREKRNSKHIIKLDAHQIKIVNDFLETKYQSTLKNIVGVLKGNNPGGEASNPQSAEMILANNESNYKNFIILFDALSLKYNRKEKNLFDGQFKRMTSMSEVKKFEQYIHKSRKIADAFKFLQEGKNNQKHRLFIQTLREYRDSYAWNSVEIEKKIKYLRRKYSQNIDKYVKQFPFGFKSSKEFQKCHIWPVYEIKNSMIKEIILGKGEEEVYLNYENYIIDINNFIPLPESLHRMFDAYEISYNEKNGKLEIYDKTIAKFIKPQFKQLDLEFLHSRKEYFKNRNEKIKGAKHA